jgi:REP-associated tyrosine transposase
MRTYLRARCPGAVYFFTVNLAQRRGNDLLVRHVDLLREVFREIRAHHPFIIEAICILPDHLHCLWRLPKEDDDFSTRWRLIKAAFSRGLPREERISRSRARKGERGIWQRRYWEHVIRDERDFVGHMDYVHYNPVKHGHVARAWDWSFSSFRRLVDEGVYERDWAANREVRNAEWG